MLPCVLVQVALVWAGEQPDGVMARGDADLRAFMALALVDALWVRWVLARLFVLAGPGFVDRNGRALGPFARRWGLPFVPSVMAFALCSTAVPNGLHAWTATPERFVANVWGKEARRQKSGMCWIVRATELDARNMTHYCGSRAVFDAVGPGSHLLVIGHRSRFGFDLTGLRVAQEGDS